jgi:hypothetical protein
MSEESEAKRDGAILQPNSGRGKHKKGDATLGPFLIDYKEYAKSFGVSISVWAKLSKDAILKGKKQPALKLVLGDERKTRVWVIGDEMFHEMLEAWREKYE